MQINTYIKNVMDDDNIRIINFLNNHGINNLNDEVIDNMNYIYINDNIMGTISFEKYNIYGLIRAFVYSKELDLSIIRKLFNNLILKCKEKEIRSLIAFIKEDEIKVFSYLGFKHINENDVFIGEINYMNTSFNRLNTYLYNI